MSRISDEKKRIWLFFCIGLISVMILSGCSLALQESTKDHSKERSYSAGSLLSASVVDVVDGDTMKVDINGKTETVRLLLVDTPESVHPDIPDPQPFAIEASDFAKEVLSHQEVELEIDVSERDKYGRLLCYLYIDGQMFNETLLEKGYARVAYVYPPNTKYVDQFREIQDEARDQGVGIWSIEDDMKSYKNCAEARAAGAAPLRKGDFGYEERMDGDKDGVACETS